MALTAPDLVQPDGLLPPDLVPRTPDEVKAYVEDGAGYATDTAKTTAYATAFLTGAYADSRVTALAAADRDGAARLYAYWRAYDARAQVLALMPRKGSADAEGSYEYDPAQIADASGTASRYETDFLAAVADPDAADDYAGWPRVHSLR